MKKLTSVEMGAVRGGQTFCFPTPMGEVCCEWTGPDTITCNWPG